MKTPARSVTHATFTIERTYDAAPARVFAAFASKEAAHYLDVVDGQRIIYSYETTAGDAKRSVSMTTIEFHAASGGRGTRLVLTEHGAFLDGHEDPRRREEGTRGTLEALAAALR